MRFRGDSSYMLLQYVQQYVPSILNGLVEVHYCQIGGLFVVCCHKGHTQLGSVCHLLQVLVAKAVPPQVRSRNGYKCQAELSRVMRSRCARVIQGSPFGM